MGRGGEVRQIVRYVRSLTHGWEYVYTGTLVPFYIDGAFRLMEDYHDCVITQASPTKHGLVVYDVTIPITFDGQRSYQNRAIAPLDPPVHTVAHLLLGSLSRYIEKNARRHVWEGLRMTVDVLCGKETVYLYLRCTLPSEKE
jgi:hypothetical protein